MATRSSERERLQPALLDRLFDEAPDRKQETAERRSIGKGELRAAILRDLAALFNSVQPSWLDLEGLPHVATSVLNYGLPPLTGALASSLDIGKLERAIRQTIIAFEPRILADSVVVKAIEAESLMDSHNQIALNLSGRIWAQPIPLEFLIRTELDLETGQVVVRDRG